MEAISAYTGISIPISSEIESLGLLSSEISGLLRIEPEDQLLLVYPTGNRFKLEMVGEGLQVYVFNKKMFQGEYGSERNEGWGNFPLIQPEQLSLDWINNARQSIVSSVQAIQTQRNRVKAIVNATDLAERHMQSHASGFAKTRTKRRAMFERVRADFEGCKDWESYWNKLKSIPGIVGKLETVLDRETVSQCWSDGSRLITELERLFSSSSYADELHSNKRPPTVVSDFPGGEDTLAQDMKSLADKLEQDLDTNVQRPDIVAEMVAIDRDARKMLNMLVDAQKTAQQELQGVILHVVQVQTRAAQQLKPVLAEIATKIHELDQKKAQVAKVIDFPFIYGVSLIELNRRESWSISMKELALNAQKIFEELRQKEYIRIDKWAGHYSSLDMIDKLVGSDTKLPLVEVSSGFAAELVELSIWSFLDSLQQIGLGDVRRDLETEFNLSCVDLEQSLRPVSGQISDLSESIRIDSGARELNLRAEVERLRGELRVQRPLGGINDGDAQQTANLKRQIETISEKLAAKTAQTTSQQAKLQDQAAQLASQQKQLVDEQEKLRAAQQELEDAQKRIAELERAASKQVAKQEPIKKTPQLESLVDKTYDLGQRLLANAHHLEAVLEKMGLQTTRKIENGAVTYEVNRVRGLSRRSSRAKGVESSSMLLATSETIPPAPRIPDPSLLHWISDDNDDEFCRFLHEVYIDYDIFRQTVGDRFGEVEKIARKYHSQVKVDHERIRTMERQLRQRLVLSQFKEGDLILFLPTRDPERVPNPWAAFNVNSPHYFLDPELAAQLGNRDFLIARATAIVERTVKYGDTENPFGLGEGFKWHMVSASWR